MRTCYCLPGERARGARHFDVFSSGVKLRQIYVFLGCFESGNGGEMFVKYLPYHNITIKVLNTWFILCKSRRIEAEAMVKLSQSVWPDA